jgi:hypothetical protein
MLSGQAQPDPASGPDLGKAQKAQAFLQPGLRHKQMIITQISAKTKARICSGHDGPISLIQSPDESWLGR